MVSRKSLEFIAEIGINHLGSIELAKRHVLAAKTSGADVAKFQTYITEKRVNKDSPIFDILKDCELAYDQLLEIKDYCEQVGIEFSSTAFCEESTEILTKLGCKTIKVASFCIGSSKLLESLFQSSEISRVVVSTGVSNKKEIDNLVKTYKNCSHEGHSPELNLLHCISQYPLVNHKDCNLSNIRMLAGYGYRVGYSDHSVGELVPGIAVAKGASIIEKHFTVDTSLKGADHAMSANPETFKNMVDFCRKVYEMEGTERGAECFGVEEDIIPYKLS